MCKVFFFVALRWAPRPFGGARAKKKKTLPMFLFLLWPRAGAQRGFSFPCRSRGRSKKKHPGWCFFLLWPRAGAQRGFSFPCLSPGPQQKKNTLGGVLFFALARAGAQLGFSFPCLFAGAAAKKIPWVVFFFCCGPARTLTHSLRAWVAMPPPRRVVLFFAAAPPGPGW